jgi:hypothetical protein
MRNEPRLADAAGEQIPDQQCQLFSDLDRGLHDLPNLSKPKSNGKTPWIPRIYICGIPDFFPEQF